jgi:glutathione S-transferase
MAEYVLHCFAQSGNCYKAALTLALCGADWTPQWVDYFGGETRSDKYRGNLNEMGEAPVLEHRGKRLAQSGVILDYLAATLGRFGAANDDERREILKWILWDNHKLTSYIATLRWMVHLAKTGEPAVHEFLRGRVNLALGILDKHLSASPFAVGEKLTIADLSMCGYLYWPEEFGVSWRDYPAIGKWLERIKAQPGWVHPYQLMPGHK